METTSFLDLLYRKSGQKPNLHHQILESLIDGSELTVISALQRFRTIELRKIISDLRAIGVPIADRWTENPSTGKRYKVNFLTGNE